MNILLLGSGAREHAFAWRIAQELEHKLFIAPGNPGMQTLGTCFKDISLDNFPHIAELVRNHSIDILVVGPEAPLVGGIVDYLRKQSDLTNLSIVGPEASGAKLEGSKEFSKDFMKRHAIPTASYRSFRAHEFVDAKEFLQTLSPPYVLKADGLAAGKGVVIVSRIEDAYKELESMFSGRFGEAGSCVVIEEYLAGIECSLFVASDGKDYRILPVAKDYKRIGEGDTGANTGGMGAISPVVFADKAFLQKVEERIVRPTIRGLQEEGIDYRGFIFIGLMNVAGDPYVIEYNCRMGDPETESVLPRIQSSFVELLCRMAQGNLGDYKLCVDPRTVVSVVLVSKGYPEDYQTGHVISLPPEIPSESIVFHAGTSLWEDDLVTSGGRVLTVSSYGNNLQEALVSNYKFVEKITYEGRTYRGDIGQDLLTFEAK